MHQRAADVEVLVEGIVQIEAEQRLALHREGALVLEGDAHRGAGVDDTLVGDGHLAHIVIDGVVAILGEGHAAGGYHNRASRHVHRVEFDGVAAAGLILALKHKLVLVLMLAGNGERTVVKFLINVLIGNGIAADFRAQVLAERLHNREDNLAGAGVDGVALEVVKAAVDILLAVGVQAVKVHHLQQRLAGDGTLREEGEFSAGGIAQVLDVEFEVVLLDLVGAQRVDVFHHQVPRRQLRRHGGALEHLDVEGLIGGSDVTRELAHLIHLAVILILIGDGERLVGAQGLLELDVAQSGVEGIFAGGENARALDFLVVTAALKAVGLQRLQHRGHLADVAGTLVVVLDLGEQVVALVGRVNDGAAAIPMAASQMLGLGLTHIHKGHQVAGLAVVAALVGNPHLDARDVYTARHQRQFRAPLVVVVAEEVREEVVAVLVILVGGDIELGGLGAALGVDRLALAVLLRDESGGRQFAKL